MKIKFLQIAIAQWEHNNKLKGVFHCTIGVNLDTNELVRMYPVELYKMRKHGVYIVKVENMSCSRENSFIPIEITQVGLYTKEQTQSILKSIPVTTISKLNEDKLSMGIIDISNKIIRVETNTNYVNDTQCDLFDGTEYSKECSLENKSYSNKIQKDIRIRFPSKETMQGFRDLSYNEFHFFVGLERNGCIPTYYSGQQYNRMIVGNLRNHRSTFIGLCMFKNNK
jgi:hypothetical protein